jgi:hypothetical protein
VSSNCGKVMPRPAARDFAACILASSNDGFEDGLGFSGNGYRRVIERIADSVISEPLVARRRQRPADGLRLWGSRAGQDIQRRFEVFGAAGHRARDGQQSREAGRAVNAAGRVAALIDDIERGLVAVDAAVRGGATYASAQVGADAQEGHAGRERRGGTPGRTARRARKIRGVVGGAVDFIEGLSIGEVQRHVCPAEEHAACLAKAAHSNRDGGCPGALQMRETPRTGLTLDTEALFHIYGHAVKEAHVFFVDESFVSARRGREGLLAKLVDVGIEFGLEGVDPGKGGSVSSRDEICRSRIAEAAAKAVPKSGSKLSFTRRLLWH